MPARKDQRAHLNRNLRFYVNRKDNTFKNNWLHYIRVVNRHWFAQELDSNKSMK